MERCCLQERLRPTREGMLLGGVLKQLKGGSSSVEKSKLEGVFVIFCMCISLCWEYTLGKKA